MTRLSRIAQLPQIYIPAHRSLVAWELQFKSELAASYAWSLSRSSAGLLPSTV